MGIALTVGSKAPAFSLPGSNDGGIISLTDFRGRKLVLFFYPKAGTSGCTREAVEFSALRTEFNRAGTDILGVSADPVKAQDAFKRKHGLTIALLSDETHRVLQAYEVWGKKTMYGKTFMGVVRTTFLIGADGRIVRIWPKVKIDGHAAEVLKAAKSL